MPYILWISRAAEYTGGSRGEDQADVIRTEERVGCLVFHRDKSVFYHIDTALSRVDAYDVQDETRLANRRTVVTVPEEEGSPDGMCMDCEGNLWIAMWGGGEGKITTQYTAALLEMARAAMKEDQHGLARDYLERALVYPESLDDKNRAHCHYLIGRGCLGLGEEKRAAASFEEALRLDPNHLNALRYRECVGDGLFIN